LQKNPRAGYLTFVATSPMIILPRAYQGLPPGLEFLSVEQGAGIMPRIKLLLVLGMWMGLGAEGVAHPPHAYHSGVVLSSKGTPVQGASVLVHKAGTKVKSQLFKGESAGTTKCAFFLDLTSAAEDVSSTGWGLSDHHAFDDKASTRWSSAAGALPPFPSPSSSHQWIWVDCGADVRLRSVWVDFQDSAAVDYTIRLLTEADGAALGVTENGKAGGGPDKWKIIATGKGLPNGLTSPNRKLPGVADKWDFVNGTAVIPDKTAGTAKVNVAHPVGRYVMVDATKASDAGYGNVSIWQITVETESDAKGPPLKSVVYTTAVDNFIEQSNPIMTDENGKYRFFVAGGDYDLHVSHASVNYSLTDVTLVNPNSPQQIRSSSQTPPLTLVERGRKTSGGNNALAFNRPGSTDGNNPPTPYRIFVNKGKQGWALTLNADWDETANAWKKRTIGNQSFVFRINGEDHSLEYGNDSFTTTIPPVMETLFRLSADGEISAKAFSGGWHGLGMEVRNNTGGNLSVGNVVVLDPSKPFSVIKPRKFADENPAVVYRVDGSRVFVLIAGRISPHTPYAGGDIGTKVKAGDFLVTEGAGSLRAVVGHEGVDPRAIIGRVSDRSLLTIIP